MKSKSTHGNDGCNGKDGEDSSHEDSVENKISQKIGQSNTAYGDGCSATNYSENNIGD